MGLDIYKFEVVDDSEDSIELYSDDTNKSKIALFEKFKDWVKESEVNGVDLVTTFEKLGKNYLDYDFVGSGGECLEFYHNETKEILCIPFNQTVDKVILVKKLPVREVEYQRKQMFSEFYTEFLAGCWYVSEDTDLQEEDSKDYIFSIEDLEGAKKFAVAGAPIKEWALTDNQFVHFNY